MRYHDDNEMCVSVLRMIDMASGQDLSSHTGLSSWKVNRCLELLQKKSLIKNEENSRVYRLTREGMQYLNSYNKLIELLSFKLEKREEIIA